MKLLYSILSKSLKINLIRFSFVLLFLFCFQNLKAAPTAPVFLKTKDWQIDKVNRTVLILKTKIAFHNPNKQKAKLNTLDLDIYFNDKFIGKVIQEDMVKIKGHSTFDIPIRIKFDLKESGFDLTNVVGLITNKKFVVNLSGYLKASVLLIPFKVKIIEQQEFKASDFL